MIATKCFLKLISKQTKTSSYLTKKNGQLFMLPIINEFPLFHFSVGFICSGNGIKYGSPTSRTALWSFSSWRTSTRHTSWCCTSSKFWIKLFFLSSSNRVILKKNMKICYPNRCCNDQAPHHQQIYGRCKHEFRNIFGIHLRHHYENWVWIW